ncbi:S-layer homology domain-containing protein [Paenibacillus sp. B-A-8]|uniref:S-layer homology domain-containing protein n=1 Tax=Paenibacillus sp. B-A-8 TaxID=3400419 RepID=UPI003B017912
MRKRKLAILICFIAVLTTAFMPVTGYTKAETGFSLTKISNQALPDKTLTVTLNGDNLNGLYAYEAIIRFDPEIVELVKAESKLEGYFITPKVEDGTMTIAFTKIGKKTGEQGNIALASILFKGKTKGDAGIQLVSVKALDPALKETVYKNKMTFDDLEGYEWARMEIETLATSGIIKGTSATTFSPGAKITRADFVSLLVRALQLDAEVEGNFKDVKQTDYFYKEVGIAKKFGIALGTGDDKFDPKQRITRQDMMVTAERAMKIAGRMLDEKDSDLSSFRDSGDVSTYAVNALTRLVKKGIIEGYNGMIKPKDLATRAEAAVIIYRLLNI